MSPDDLRREAVRHRAVARARRRGADALTVVGRSLDGRFDGIIADSQRAWTGVAASGFAAMIRATAERLEEIRSDLRHITWRLLAEAERRLEEARSLEARAEALEVAAPIGTPV